MARMELGFRLGMLWMGLGLGLRIWLVGSGLVCLGPFLGMAFVLL